MYFGLFDPTMYLLIPAIILALWAQTKVHVPLTNIQR